MNYSHQELKKKQKKLVSKSKRIKCRLGEWAAYCGVILAVTFLLLVVFGLSGAIRGVIDNAPAAKGLDMMAKGQSSVIVDGNGKVIQTLSSDDLLQEYVSIEEIPECVRQAFIASEDKRFYEHHGVDMFGLMQALYAAIMDEKEEKRDNRTITQQLIQNQILPGKQGTTFFERFTRAIKEQHLAIELEDSVDKLKVLEYYLNTVNLGQNMVGVQAAAGYYFDKEISEVSVSEAAVLAAITSDPAKYDPASEQRHNERKRQTVLKSMLDEGYISEEEYEEALGDDVYLRIQNVKSTKANRKNVMKSYYSDAVVKQVIQDLKENLGYSQTEAYNVLYHEGLRIYACQDSTMQRICDEVVNADRYYPKTVRSYLSYSLVVEQEGKKREYSELDIKNYFLDKKGEEISLYFKEAAKAKEYVQKFRAAMLKSGGRLLTENVQLVKQPQASFVLIEQATGEVRAIAGGRGQKIANREINRATESKRQPGSVLAMLSTYAPAIDTARITLGNVEDDAPYQYPGTETQVGQQGERYQGLMTLRQAMIQSKNIPAVKTLKKVSVQTGYEFLKKFCLTTIVEHKKNEEGQIDTDLQLQMALGGLNEGVTNLELTAAYAAIANGGVYQEPHFYTKIVDSEGNVLLDNQKNPRRILKKGTAWLLTHAMQDAVQDGTGKEAQFKEIGTAQAGNIGHTTNNTDFWFEGCTPYYTAGIWLGQDENTSQKASNCHMAIWRDIMERIHQVERKTEGNFVKPDKIVSRRICTKCGKLAVSGLCDKAQGGSASVNEYFVSGTEPQQNCSCHVKYAFCKESKLLAGEDCPKNNIYYRVFLQKQETAKTADTPNTVSHNVTGQICQRHRHSKKIFSSYPISFGSRHAPASR